MFLEIWKAATGSLTSTFSLGSASKLALFLLGSGVLVLGVGSVLSGSANLFKAVKNRALDLTDSEEDAEDEDSGEANEGSEEDEAGSSAEGSEEVNQALEDPSEDHLVAE